jgi:hypothetical protein
LCSRPLSDQAKGEISDISFDIVKLYPRMDIVLDGKLNDNGALESISNIRLIFQAGTLHVSYIKHVG